ncbi:hypothetical protein BKK81_32470 [Cupriavidus sp. USMAHM13]|nr:hypothetical protein BKK81_32470 [Cupriavidus sp. USMAHM13]
MWAVVERGKALSSLATEDALAHRAFLRRPTPHQQRAATAGGHSGDVVCDVMLAAVEQRFDTAQPTECLTDNGSACIDHRTCSFALGLEHADHARVLIPK